MKILISGFETCGLICDLAAHLRQSGHQVTTVGDGNAFYDGTFDYAQTDFLSQWFAVRAAKRTPKWFLKALWHSKLYHPLESRLRTNLLKGCELYIQICAGVPNQREMLEKCRSLNIPSAVLLMGSDVRDYPTFVKDYDVGDWQIPESYLKVPTRSKRQRLYEVETLADAVFSVPDQMGLATRPYYHLQVPLKLEKFRPHISGQSKPKVLHAPSNSSIKGTKLIEATIERLEQEGVPLEYVRLSGVAHTEVIRILADVDVVVDELVLHGPGWLSFEAMASGCAVATRYLEDSPACFRPPVVNIDHRCIYAKLRQLLLDRQMRVRLAEIGLEYVKKNSISQVVNDIIQKAQRPNDFSPDYYPARLPNTIQPASELQSRTPAIAIETTQQVSAR
jgi:hypothetical protein